MTGNRPRWPAGGLLLLAGLTGCLDGTIVNWAMQDRSRELPPVADNLVLATVEGAPAGAQVRVFAGGEVLEGLQVGEQSPGAFRLAFPGNTAFSGLRVEARWESGQAFGVIPSVPRQRSVVCPERVVACLTGENCKAFHDALPPECREAAPPAVLPPLGEITTAATLALLGKGLDAGGGLASFSCVLGDQVEEFVARYQGNDPEVTAFVGLVRGWLALAGREGRYPFAGALGPGAGIEGLADDGFLQAFAAQLPVPPTGCGGADPSVPPTPGDQKCAFAALLRAAAGRVTVVPQPATDRIRVVFQADFRAGGRDGNCTAVDRFKWAREGSGKRVYLTGGIHKTTPVCGSGANPPFCLTQQQVDEANAALGNWVPNLREMVDDGTQGDSVRGDGIWTFVADLPAIPLEDSPHGIGVRIGYKFTYGLPGQGWTDSEEWPGNQRLLELVDVNGDGLVVRRDVFGDEATNKDKANQLLPSNGGCGGVNLWETDPAPAACPRYLHDTRERPVDLDGDCTPDGWPQAGSVAPIFLGCD
ncbi:hypothetical protein KBD49_08620 [Myxococcota bacterium]|nr:hypothetical protein [Myxococcota bacterium]